MTILDRLDTRAHRTRLRTADFFALSERGAFQDHAKTELLDGEIWTMNAQHRPHAMAKMDLYDALRDALKAMGSSLRAVTEATVHMGDHDAPEPDIILTSEPYGEGAVPLASVALVIEVADATVAHDRSLKRDIYARHGIAEYWVIDLPERIVHQYWSPANGRYRHTATSPFGSALAAQTLADLSISADLR